MQESEQYRRWTLASHTHFRTVLCEAQTSLTRNLHRLETSSGIWVRQLTLPHALAATDDPPPSYATATAPTIDPPSQSSEGRHAHPTTVLVVPNVPCPTDVGTGTFGEEYTSDHRVTHWSNTVLHFSSTTPALWWGLQSATKFLFELVWSDGLWNHEKKSRVTEVALAIIWVSMAPSKRKRTASPTYVRW